MNYRMILQLESVTLRIVAAFMLPAMVISFAYDDPRGGTAFIITMLIMLALSLPSHWFKPRKRALHAKDGIVLVASTWTFISLLGGLPFYLSGAIPSIVDSFFETASGFTTTGATILTNVEALNEGMLYWRSFTHWLGGMGVLVFMLSIASLSIGTGEGIFIMRAETTSPLVSKLVPRTMQTARMLYGIYIVMTGVMFILLLIGKMPVFDALTCAFGTAGTGGFSITNDSLASYSPYIQWTVTVFMLLFGVNFGIYYLLLARSFKRAFLDEELRVYVIIVLAATLILTLLSYTNFATTGEAVRHSAFTVATIMSTTGFATTDYNTWGQAAHIVIILLMIIGGCSGSTAGGVKVSRIIVFIKDLKAASTQKINATSIRQVKLDGKALSNDTVRSVYTYLSAYVMLAVVSLFIISFDGFDFETNFSGIMATLNNIGPGFNVVGPTGNYSQFSDLSKLVMSFDMLAGRLGIFPMLLFFVPRIYAREKHYRTEN